ncbi:hypothetical protein BVC80_9095g153 [Macleaya cordata]|uniref:Uncharacterized protein n=1 Tax=Macleaya cordata TaxID=56857 RepID=A0A200PXP2_MACCD|nr:hypothetical protein BVC80_9095g153 [Macleaya cordata]
MSISCLNCQTSKRSDREPDCGLRLCCIGVDRSWSGNLTPPPYEQIGNGSSVGVTSKGRKGHRRIHSTGVLAFEGRSGDSGEPRLLRSCGMRRDWSFENLRQIREEA